MSKKITAHPAVAECANGHASGFEARYDVTLKDGFKFSASGKDDYDATQSRRFQTVAEFCEWARLNWIIRVAA